MADVFEMTTMADGARWVVIVALALAGVEKATTLRHHSAAWHPVMLANPMLRRYASVFVAVGLVSDIVVIAALLWRPFVGGVASAALVGCYTISGLRVQVGNHRDCRCFSLLINSSTRGGLLRRNLFLVGLSGVLATVTPRPGVGTAIWSLLLLSTLVWLARPWVRDHVPDDRFARLLERSE
jgi:hypothetical protein